MYYTQARFDTAFGNKSTTNLAEGTNLYYTTARENADFDTRLGTKSTTNLTEGTNLYYTAARVGSYLTANSYATQSYVGTQIANLVAAAPATLDTLNELAAALGNDPSFATTVATSIGTKVPQSRTITINGTAYDLSADRSWTIASGVTSFNTRTGAITPVSGDYTTALVTESGNLYYTNARARLAISLTTTGTSGAASYDNTTGVLNIPQYQGGVTSFNTRTGAITLSSSDVTTALTYTPVTNARTISINGTSYDLSADRSWTIAPDVSVRNTYAFTATAAQTTFTVTGGYTVGLVDVFINGVKLAAADFTATNGTTVVLGTGTGVGNIVEIVKYVSAFTTAVQTTRTLTINGTTYDLSADRTWSITNTTLGAQPALSGTGFVKISGTTISYDNSTYLTTASASSTYQTILTNPITGTGTTNYLPKFTGSSTIGNSLVYDNGSFIGINTTTNGGILSINGADPLIGFQNAGSTKWQVGLENTVSDRFVWYNNAGAAYRMILTASGNLGLGVTPSAWGSGTKAFQLQGGSLWSYSSAYLDLYQNGYYDGTYNIYLTTAAASFYRQSSGSHQWFNAPSGTAGASITFTQAMTLNASGNLSIGNTNNTYKLDVSGQSVIRASATNGVVLQAVATDSNNTIYLRPNNSGYNLISSNYLTSSPYLPLSLSGRENNTDLVLTTSGNVEIGNSAVANLYKLDVNGTGRFSGNLDITVANTPQILLTHSNTSKTFLMAVDGSNAFFRANSTNNILFQVAGGVTALTLASTQAATFSSSLQTNSYQIINGVAGGTSTYLQFNNNGTAIGYVGSSAAINSGASTSVTLGVASGAGLTIASTGASTFSSSVTVGTNVNVNSGGVINLNSQNGFQLGADAYSGGFYIYDNTAGVYRFKIANGGAAIFSSTITAAALSQIGSVYIGGRTGTYAEYADGIFGDNLHLAATTGAVYINTLLNKNTYINPVGGNVGINATSLSSKFVVYEGDIRLWKNHLINQTGTWKSNIIFTDEVDRLGARIVGERTAWDGAPMALGFDTGGVGSVTRRMTIASNGFINITNTGQPISDDVGCFQLENTTAASTSASNVSFTLKNYNGTGQYLMWENYGIRLGSRIKTNTGAGGLYFTYGNDAVGLTLSSLGHTLVGPYATDQTFWPSWDGGVIRIGPGGTIFHYRDSVTDFMIGGNYYIRSGDAQETRIGSGGSCNLYMANGDMYFRTAVSGAAGSSISWNVGLYVKTNGFVGVNTQTHWNNEKLGIQTSSSAGYSAIPSLVRLTNYTSGGITKITFTDSSIIDGWIGMVPISNGSYFAMGFSGYTEQGFKLYQNGNYYFAGTNVSDRRAKSNIQELNNSLEKVLRLKPSTFSYNDNPYAIRGGFIAQEVKEVFPEFVSTTQHEDEMMGVDYNGMIAVLTKAIQELKSEIDILKAR